MYCPRCGTQAIETTKFCRSCGLPLTPVTSYVTTGGTMPLQSPPVPTDNSLQSTAKGFWNSLPPGQQMAASILAFIFSVPVLGILAGGRLAGIAAVLMPLGIIWSVMYFGQKKREWERMKAAQPTQAYVSPPTQTYQAPAPPPVQTNPLATDTPPAQHWTPPSVTEEATQPLPPPRQAQ